MEGLSLYEQRNRGVDGRTERRWEEGMEREEGGEAMVGLKNKQINLIKESGKEKQNETETCV